MRNLSVKKKAYTSCAGFTFLELMVVLVIMSVILAIAAPRLGKFYDSVKLDGNARQLKILLMYAKNKALIERKICRFYYIAAKREFIIKIQKDPEKDPDFYISIPGNVSRVKLSTGVNLVDARQVGSRPVPPNTDFDFDIVPMGNEYEYYFTLEGAGQEKVNVIVEAGSGIVRIEKNN